MPQFPPLGIMILISSSQCRKEKNYRELFCSWGPVQEVWAPSTEVCSGSITTLLFGTPNILLGLDLPVLGRSQYLIHFSCCWSTCLSFFLPSLLITCEDESSFILKHVFSSALVLTASEDPQPQQHPTATAARFAAAAAKGTQNIQTNICT